MNIEMTDKSHSKSGKSRSDSIHSRAPFSMNIEMTDKSHSKSGKSRSGSSKRRRSLVDLKQKMEELERYNSYVHEQNKRSRSKKRKHRHRHRNGHRHRQRTHSRVESNFAVPQNMLVYQTQPAPCPVGLTLNSITCKCYYS